MKDRVSLLSGGSLPKVTFELYDEFGQPYPRSLSPRFFLQLSVEKEEDAQLPRIAGATRSAFDQGMLEFSDEVPSFLSLPCFLLFFL